MANISAWAHTSGVALLLATFPVAAQEKKVPSTTEEARSKLLALDAELREAFNKTVPKGLPESKRKLADASASSFDWVKVMGLTPVHQQGGKPSCVAQASVAALEWSWQIRNGTKTKPILSPQPILDRLRVESFTFEGALDQLLMFGVAPYGNYPYSGEVETLRTKVPTPYRLVGWGVVGPEGKISVKELKQALLTHGPLVVSVYTSTAFQNYKGGVFAESLATPKYPTNHAVVIIGWDDRRGKGCWHIQNSWGLNWGDGGGMWIEYGCHNIGHEAHWVRAQSVQYNLPKDAHQLLGEAVAFQRWPSAKDLPVTLKKSD